VGLFLRPRGYTSVQGFRDFISRGNVIDLAVAVVIGTAFTAVVTAFVADIITPLIAAIGGKPNFGGLFFTVNHSKFLYGSFVNAVITFLILAAVVYYPDRRADGEDHRPLHQGGRSHHPGPPRVPEHDPDRGHPLHVLHRPGPAGDAAGRRGRLA
jgi:large conductance mechanosensitive channel protein